MNNKYVDVAAITQVIGCVLNNPTILDDTDKYVISDKDFVEEFHRVVFGSIYNIHRTGSAVSIDSIVDYLANRPKYEAVFKANKGIEYLTEASNEARALEFNYYYGRLKKFSLLRAYDSIGLDVSFLYDPMNVLDLKKKQKQEDWLDSTSLIDIANIIDKKIDDIKLTYIERLKQQPEIGIPLHGPLINTVTR